MRRNHSVTIQPFNQGQAFRLTMKSVVSGNVSEAAFQNQREQNIKDCYNIIADSKFVTSLDMPFGKLSSCPIAMKIINLVSSVNLCEANQTLGDISNVITLALVHMHTFINSKTIFRLRSNKLIIAEKKWLSM